MKNDNAVLLFLNAVCWTKEIPEYSIDVLPSIYNEFKCHAILGMGVPALASIKIHDKNIYQKWRIAIYQQFASYHHNLAIQKTVLSALKGVGIQAVVLKGTAAAQYYPTPEYRTLGDIDLMVKRTDYTRACQVMLDLRCTENIVEQNKERHRSFQYNGVEIQIHRRFASLNNADQAELMDQYILNAISDNPYLPDDVNGLVILQHISQHLEGRIGLRQILDWMYFVNRFVDDKYWYIGFQQKVTGIGLETLAITLTKMCQLYLGLRVDLTWCANADEKLCKDLMEYVLESGNFGCKQNVAEEKTITKLTSYRNPIAFLKHMQIVGLKEWDKSKKHPVLTPFAWLWNSIRLFKLARLGRVDFSTVTKAKERVELLQRLQVKQNSKGIAHLINGRLSK